MAEYVPIQFPGNFIWGAATAGHQVEGNNVNSDWWVRENAPDSKLPERSGMPRIRITAIQKTLRF